jgi:hypothetical protein
MEEYEDENNPEYVDDEDEEMVNENIKDGDAKGASKPDGIENPPNIQIKPPGTKQKRRSKNDCKGRDYVCGCNKTYLSYPALYTHIKTKHNGKTPEGTNANQVTNGGRGRGRPRKNFLINEESGRKRNLDISNPIEDNPEIKELYRPYEQNTSEINDEIYIKIYSNLGLLGGPTWPLEGIPDEYSVLKKKVDYIMENNLSDKLLNREDDHKVHITCDDLFALFLIEISKMATSTLYKLMVIYIQAYRDCMNKIGWETLSNYKTLESEPTNLEYTIVKNGDYLPQICNDFLVDYLPSHLKKFDKYLAVVFTNHFCDFLYKFNFTRIKLKYSEK